MKVVVVGAYRLDPEASGLDRVDVAAARDRPGYAGGPELDIATGAFPQSPAAHDVGERQPAAGSKHARGFGEDPVLDGREIDHAVGDDGVETGVLEREIVDARLEKFDLAESVAVSQVSRLGDLLVREVDPYHSPRRADLE